MPIFAESLSLSDYGMLGAVLAAVFIGVGTAAFWIKSMVEKFLDRHMAAFDRQSDSMEKQAEAFDKHAEASTKSAEASVKHAEAMVSLTGLISDMKKQITEDHTVIKSELAVIRDRTNACPRKPL